MRANKKKYMIANQTVTSVVILSFDEAICRIQNTIEKDDQASLDTLRWMRNQTIQKWYPSRGDFEVIIGRAPFERHATFSVFISTLAHLCENLSFRREVFREEHELIVDTSGAFGDEFIVFGVDLKSNKQTPRIRKTRNLNKKDLTLYRMVWLP